MNYSCFTRSELFTLIRDKKKKKKKRAALLNVAKGLIHPSEEKIKETQADLDNMVTVLNSASITTPSIAQKSAYNYNLAMRQQSLRDAMKQKKKKFHPGIDVNQFITALNKAYMIHVIPELTTYPSLEEEFVKAAQDLLDQGIFQQMVDSKDTPTFEKLKTYLIGTHGSQMTNFQHLSQAWDLQRHDGENLTDFAGRHENTIREAAVHIKINIRRITRST